MPMIQSAFPELAIPVIYNFYEIGQSLRPSMIPMLYNVQTSSRSKEENIGIGGISPDAWDNYEKSGAVSDVDFSKGYTKTYTHAEKVVSMTVERKHLDDDQYGILSDRARKMGISAMQKKEIDAASVFNNAFSASYLGADGVALCSNSHPQSPDKAGSTQDNNFTLSLSKANVRTIREAMMAFTDDSGNKLGVTPNMLLVPPALEDDAREIALSVLDPSTGNNTINPQFGRFQVVPWHQLTDSNAWFMIDSIWMKEQLRWYTRRELEVKAIKDTSTAYTWEFYMRYSYGWDDWRWVAGSNPS